MRRRVAVLLGVAAALLAYLVYQVADTASRTMYGPCWITEQYRDSTANLTYHSLERPTLKEGFASGVDLSGQPFVVGGQLDIYPSTCVVGWRE